MDCKTKYLSEINIRFIHSINEFLNIKTNISNVSDYNIGIGKSERLVELCKKLGANEYISGYSAIDYLDTGLFMEEGIKVTWMNYSGYPVYNQLWPPFNHNVSIIDLVFAKGPDSSGYFKSVQ
jgi:hypothetical protein